MPKNSQDNAPRDYEIKSYGPGDVASTELTACLSIIKAGGAVNPDSAKNELPQAIVVALARIGDKIVGVGAIRRVRPTSAFAIADRSRFPLPQETRELGYVAVDSNHRNKGLSLSIVRELLLRHKGRLFAITSNEYMKKTLTKAGFAQAGHEWNGGRGLLSLWMRG